MEGREIADVGIAAVGARPPPNKGLAQQVRSGWMVPEIYALT